MKIKCMICDRVDHLEENEFIAKRIRNNPLISYLCTDCNERIADKTKVRQLNRNKANDSEASSEESTF